MQSFNMYGPMSNNPQQPGPQAYAPWQQNRSGYKDFSENAYQAGVGAQSNKDAAAFMAAGNLGVAGQNAMAQYGANRANTLANSHLAQLNALGQLGTGYYNTLGQLGQANAGMTAAASQAGADTNKAAALGGLASGMVNAGMYGAQAGAYGMGNMPNFSFGGGYGGGRGGFRASGPEGPIASGSQQPQLPILLAGGGGTGGRQFNAPPTPPYMQGGGGGGVNPYEPFREGSQYTQQMLWMMQNPNSMPNLVRKDMNSAFNTTQRNLMDPGIENSLNGQMAMGYGALDSLYSKSDYGFNTGSRSFRPQHYNPRSSGGFYNY